MSVFFSRWSAGGLAFLALAILCMGCARQAPAPIIVSTQQTDPVDTEPGEMELSDPKVTFTEPNLVRFEVTYRFTRGKPTKYYLCEITFPGTKNHGAKPMENWELKTEGVIKDGIILSKPPVRKFEIRVSEADSPQQGYRKISNVISGEVK
jgi:hypothetical protein